MNKDKTKKWISILALMGIIAAWLLGIWRTEEQHRMQLTKFFPAEFSITQNSKYIFEASNGPAQKFYVSIGSTMGYEGPVVCALVVDSLGLVNDIKVLKHTETHSYFNKIIKRKFIDQFLNRSLKQILQNEKEVDVVSGATYTSIAISKSVKMAALVLAKDRFNIPVPTKEKKLLHHVSFLDILVLFLLIAVIFSRNLNPVLKKRFRYTIMIMAIVTLGFTYNFHLSISRFNSLLLGYWPDMSLHLSWYLLVFGVIGLTILYGKNPYCQWFCPFGAVQEGVGKIGKRHIYLPTTYRKMFVWIPRFIAWLAIVIALLYRNPGLTSFEVFGKFFTLTGSDVLFTLTVISLIFSVFINRPWCRYLCPVPPVLDYITYARNQVKSVWQTKK